MKKLCAILMVLTLTVSLLTGCDNVPDLFSDENGEEKATEVVTGFCDATYLREELFRHDETAENIELTELIYLLISHGDYGAVPF